MTRILPLFVVALLGTTAPTRAGTVTQKNGAASLEIRWDANAPTLELADLINVTLTVEGDASLRVIAPLELAGDAKWQLVTRTGDSRKAIGKDRVRWCLSYQFAPREPGRIPFVFPEVKYFEKSVQEKANWTPVEFDVKSPRQTELRDITGVEAPTPLAPLDRTPWIVSGLVGAALVFVALAFTLRRILRRAVPRAQEDIAISRLFRLLGKRLPEKGHGERFVTLLTLIVRRYLDRALDLSTRRRTTPEFAESIDGCRFLNLDEKQFLTIFFLRSDAVKFASSEISVEECARWAEAVRQFLLGRSALGARSQAT